MWWYQLRGDLINVQNNNIHCFYWFLSTYIFYLIIFICLVYRVLRIDIIRFVKTIYELRFYYTWWSALHSLREIGAQQREVCTVGQWVTVSCVQILIAWMHVIVSGHAVKQWLRRLCYHSRNFIIMNSPKSIFLKINLRLLQEETWWLLNVLYWSEFPFGVKPLVKENEIFWR